MQELFEHGQKLLNNLAFAQNLLNAVALALRIGCRDCFDGLLTLLSNEVFELVTYWFQAVWFFPV